MKIKKLKLILKKDFVIFAIVAALSSANTIKVSAVEGIGEKIANEIMEEVEHKVKSEAIENMAIKAEDETDESGENPKEDNPNSESPESKTSDAEKQGTKASDEKNADTEASEEEAKDEQVQIVYENIDITSFEDLVEFSKNCKSDAWSLNKIVTLKADIDLTDRDFETIPYFNGIFKGEKHSIKGYGNVNDNYITGLFRYIGPNGMVQDLNVTGSIKMTDEMKFTGGLCGMNQGIIKDCSFSGHIEGNNTVGPIAAINERTGIINNCKNDAHVSGYYFTGGIAGKNYGIVSGSSNNGNINDSADWVVKDDAKSEGILQSITAMTSEEGNMLRSGTDTGGIAGYSKGSIVRCTNKGNIGYEHAGYNIGGIVGRQMGIVSYSTNTGTINGRKDVGGIVGQMEPYLEPEDLQTLPEAADKLHDLVEQTLNDMDGGVDTISSDVSNLTTYTNGVVDDGHAIAGEITTSVNQNIRVLNVALERFEYVMQNIPGVLDHLSGASDKMYYFNNAVARAIEAINVGGEVSEDDRYQIENSENQIYDNIAKANENKQRIENITGLINQLMYETDENGDYVYDEEGVRKLRALNAEEQKQLNAYLAELQQLTTDSGSNVSGMFGSVSTILETYKPYAESAGDEVIGETQNAIAALQDADYELKEATNGTRSIIDYLNSQEKLRLTGLGSDFDASLDSLHANLRGITGSLENINQDGKSTSHTLNSNLNAVNDQVNVIYHIISDKFDIIYNDNPEVFTDVSDEEIEKAKTGRVDSSRNKGTVKGDINIGGIAGAMAIDEEDPEENAAGNLSIGKGSKYTLKNIICECENEATVESKKDGAGLIVGYMAQGIVTSSNGYGLVKSLEGSYTGGIAGQSLSIIRDCNSLCLLDGNKYVGGITGYGTTITGCKAMVTWQKKPEERFGSVAGIVNTDPETKKAKLDNISGNYFVESKIGGIDDISLASIAEPVTYNGLLESGTIPNQFRHLKVVFEVEGEKLGEQELAYGDSMEKLVFPEGELREGYYIKWPDVTGMTMDGSYVMTGEYVATNKAIESSELYEDTQKHIAILGGSYGDDAQIVAETVDEPKYEIKSPTVEKKVVKYKISIDEGTYSQAADRKIRLYNPFKNSVVKVYRDGDWVEIPSKKVGSYLEIEMENNEEVFAIVERTTLFTRIIYLLAVAAVIGVIVLLVNKAILKHDFTLLKKRKGKKKEETDEKK
ncbi:methyl-accepting chemotaxis protein [Butyrivibrio sp. AE3004]|uniref:methyl-accepting chemotaxis protein n=1 Tax=Butyrivibrio sp. AE3004 TaxID=1506994 RepID=UPI0004943572|nr:methyl-accepting chemotaxis protein [Butyrivibrio sp. AE3004]